MTTKKSQSDRNLTKLKTALAAGGLTATLLGAGLLGSQARAVAATTTTTNATETTVTTFSIEEDEPAVLNLNLEAIPTVAAPTFRSFTVARGRSS